MAHMKQLTDNDIEQMAGNDFVPDMAAVRRSVRGELHLRTLIPDAPAIVPDKVTLDLHEHTVEQAWDKIMNLATSGVRHATIITGASGVLRPLFMQWTRDSILAPYVVTVRALNNGSFAVQFRKTKK